MKLPLRVGTVVKINKRHHTKEYHGATGVIYKIEQYNDGSIEYIIRLDVKYGMLNMYTGATFDQLRVFKPGMHRVIKQTADIGKSAMRCKNMCELGLLLGF